MYSQQTLDLNQYQTLGPDESETKFSEIKYSEHIMKKIHQHLWTPLQNDECHRLLSIDP